VSACGVALRVRVVEGLLPELPCSLDDGRISGGAEFRGIIPLPYVVETRVRFEARNLHRDLVYKWGLGIPIFGSLLLFLAVSMLAHFVLARDGDWLARHGWSALVRGDHGMDVFVPPR
jgi:hypothetical protein